ncbi:Leukotoxin [Ascidiaceihabitans donghaensis]|uniref:Leukotoxin n=2 Tax=Ascidiaceihabitans donghaensis TaxID=1510460 RepID=A0A2R8B8V4_9RHOB|nr:Leukotoxin [Ascidiaceihabitans donghaensis]
MGMVKMAATIEQDGSDGHVCDENCGADCDHGHDHSHTHENIDAIGGDGTSDAAPVFVDDYTAILYYTQNDNLRWNGGVAVGTQTVVTYSFTDTADLPALADYDPYEADAYWSYTEAQRTLMRQVMDKYEAVSGLKFVEVQGEGMINIMGAEVSGVGGWANVAQAYNNEAGTGYFVNAYQNQAEGAYGYQVNLHELGHALGLQHPFEGNVQLNAGSDNQDNTVMTYNIDNPYTTELGTFDVQAMQEIYGAAGSFDNWTVTVSASDVVTIKTTFADQADVVVATNVDTVIKTYSGDDTLVGRQGNDTLNGGKGDDTITGAEGRDFILGNQGNDLIYGDINDVDYSGSANDIDRIYGNTGNDTIHGGRSVDVLNGGVGDDVLYGGYGNDRLRGSDGNDTIYSGDGDDRITGGAGNDVFIFQAADQNELNKITDFTSGEDLVDMSFWGFTSLSQFTLTQVGNHVLMEYSTWIDIGFLNTQIADLSNSDFIFA